MALRPVSVSQLTEYIGRVLRDDPLLSNISVVGEITNLKYHSSGHVYFSLVDSASKINCFLAADRAAGLPLRLADGMEVVIRGYISVYRKGGGYTLSVRAVELTGEGTLAQAFQRQKERLAAEGLFDPAHKQPIPAYPRTVGVVTSSTGAAVQDILKIIRSRTGMVDVIIFPVLVQGAEAPADIAAMLDLIDRTYYGRVDVLIVGRGGGSLEDLWAFNEEIVARAIYRCRIPVISAVGHEIDFTIADFVADRRAETPTAAAEMAVPADEALRQQIEAYRTQLLQGLRDRVRYGRLSLHRAGQEMELAWKTRIERQRRLLERYRLLLEENRPARILQKGYAMLERADGTLITGLGGLREGERYRISLRDGAATFTMTDLDTDGAEAPAGRAEASPAPIDAPSAVKGGE